MSPSLRIVALIVSLGWVIDGGAEALDAHPGVVAGALENGVEYRIFSRAVPPGRVSLRLHLPVGSLQEADDERGYAHLLEHVAFAGSENFGPGQLIPFFEAMGLTVGQHQNAVTAIDQTFYLLELPDTTDATLASGLTFLADVLGRLKIADGGVAQERAVVLAERRNGLGPGQRLMEQWLPRVLEGSLAAERMLLGTDETVREATAEKLEAFYRRWYTAGNATVVFVGDVPVDRAHALIEAAFGGLPAASATAPVDPGSVKYDTSFGVVATDPDARGASIGIVRMGPPRSPVTTIEDARENLVTAVATSAFNRRLAAKVSAGEVAFQNGGASTGNFFGTGWIANAGAAGEPEDWRAMLTDLATEIRRARVHGFSAREIQDARATILTGARQFAQNQATLPSQVHASIIMGSIHTGHVLQSGEQRLALIEALLPDISVEEASAAFRALFDSDAMAVTLSMKAGEQVPDEAEVLSAALAGFEGEVAVLAERDRPTELLAERPTPGKVVADSVDEETGVYSAWLANGVRLHHRQMQEREKQVVARVTLAGGLIEEADETIGLTGAAVGTLRRVATRTHSSVALRDFLVGRTVSVGVTGADDAVFVNINGTPDALKSGFQIAHLLMTEPHIEPVAFDQWKLAMLSGLEAARKYTGAEMTRIQRELRYPSDRRWLLREPEEIELLQAEAVEAWITGVFARAPIEVAIVGDISREAAVALALQYIGSLPARERIGAGHFATLRDAVPPAGPAVHRATMPSATPQAAVLVGFSGANHDEIDDVRALAQAGRILSSRMSRRIREEEGLAYNIAASHRTIEVADGLSTFSAETAVDPAEAERLVGLVEEMFAAFAESGPTEDEATVALRQFENSFAETVRNPSYWMRRLSDLTYRGRQTRVSAEETLAGYQSITAAHIHEVFKRYYAGDTKIRIVVLPE
ncbi:MAG: insulinase family protein [Gammaproteobacteria bacterium]